MIINRCFDSHVHFSATGWLASSLNLKNISSLTELNSMPLKPEFFRGSWLVGFGWDENKFINPNEIRDLTVDELNFDFPIALTRADGHSMLVNSVALALAKKNTDLFSFLQSSPQAEKNQMGNLTGLLKEEAKFAFDSLIPAYSEAQEVGFLMQAQDYFLGRGFTHVRDMSGSLRQSRWLLDLEKNEKLNIFIESNYTIEKLNDLDAILADLSEMRKIESKFHRALGVKIYFDGSLGSETALLSKAYANGSHNFGVRLWKTEDIKEVMRRTWQEGLEVSIHAIGDQGAHEIIQAAHQVYNQGHRGRLNLEHGQMLRSETINDLSQLDCVVHMQPCHFLSDQKWLKQKLGELSKYAFPWAQLEKKGIRIQFGSDSPIEESSLAANLEALKEAQKFGIETVSQSPFFYHSHPDSDWGKDCYSEFSSDGTFLGFKAK